MAPGPQAIMKFTTIALLLTTASFAAIPSAQLPVDGAVSVAEFYLLAAQFQDQLRDGWKSNASGAATGNRGYRILDPSSRAASEISERERYLVRAIAPLPPKTAVHLSGLWPTIGHRHWRSTNTESKEHILAVHCDARALSPDAECAARLFLLGGEARSQ